MEIEEQIAYDLKMSGLCIEDIRARNLDISEKAACGIPPNVEGYLIPYYNIVGKPLPFYRVKLFGHTIKYKQLKNTSNHVYYPPHFFKTLQDSNKNYIILTEGEKKAAAAVKHGFPAVAFSGVDSWKNRMLLLPKGTEIGTYSYNKNLMGAKLPSTTLDTPGVVLEPIAAGFEDLANMIYKNNLHAIIIYDTDESTTLIGMKPEVQRAAAELGFELRSRSIPVSNIKQAILPLVEGLDKTGLDDFLSLLEDGSERLSTLIDTAINTRGTFPQHPNMQENLNKKLQNTKLSRRDLQKLSMSLITDLDGKGLRMYSEDEDQLYYFEEKGNRLIKVLLTGKLDQAQHTPFSKLLYKSYGISLAADSRIIKWINAQFSGEDPVADVDPFRVFARTNITDDFVRFQINDGQYVKITGDSEKPIEILSNGVDNILFESNQVEKVDAKELMAEFTKRQEEPLDMWWRTVLDSVRLKHKDRTADLISLLYYISPWLLRWRGTQLPAELVIGEAGSGKSTLCELRLSILTGNANLRNAPADLKDWHASIINTGGLHVTDNIQLLDKNLKQRLSDEICRLITEPDPHIEQRKYYTNADLVRLKVDSVFCFTAIAQPFLNSDLLQRAIKIELDKMVRSNSTNISYDSAWKQRQIDAFGGRAAWLSHHLYVLHRFFALVKKRWNPNYQAQHRLINLEQILMIMAEVFGMETDWIPAFLSSSTDNAIVDADWTFEGITAFVNTVRDKPEEIKAYTGMSINGDTKFTAKHIASWAEMQDDYMDCQNLINSRRLGRYLQTHKAMVAQIAGLHDAGKSCNKVVYVAKPKPKVKLDK